MKFAPHITARVVATPMQSRRIYAHNFRLMRSGPSAPCSHHAAKSEICPSDVLEAADNLQLPRREALCIAALIHVKMPGACMHLMHQNFVAAAKAHMHCAQGCMRTHTPDKHRQTNIQTDRQTDGRTERQTNTVKRPTPAARPEITPRRFCFGLAGCRDPTRRQRLAVEANAVH